MEIAAGPATRIWSGPDGLGECPTWDERTSSLYWVDIVQGVLHRHSERDSHTAWRVGEVAASFSLTPEADIVVVAAKDEIHGMDLRTGHMNRLGSVALAETERFNDGRADPRGRFVVGTLVPKGSGLMGAIYSFDGRQVRRIINDVAASNAIAWSPSGSVLYACCSRERTIRAYDYDIRDGSVGNRRIFADLRDIPGVADGAAVDVNGHLWVAMAGSGKVMRFDADGRVTSAISFDAPWVTACCFGGADMRTLYVTSATAPHDAAELRSFPAAGSLMAVTVATPGLPHHRATINSGTSI